MYNFLSDSLEGSLSEINKTFPGSEIFILYIFRNKWYLCYKGTKISILQHNFNYTENRTNTVCFPWFYCSLVVTRRLWFTTTKTVSLVNKITNKKHIFPFNSCYPNHELSNIDVDVTFISRMIHWSGLLTYV